MDTATVLEGFQTPEQNILHRHAFIYKWHRPLPAPPLIQIVVLFSALNAPIN